jgi:hypothetical protein
VEVESNASAVRGEDQFGEIWNGEGGREDRKGLIELCIIRILAFSAKEGGRSWVANPLTAVSQNTIIVS